jgi:flagellar hook-basal body complex protein FliE
MNPITLSNLPNAVMPSTSGGGLGGGQDGASFGDVLKNAVSSVNSLNDNAAAQVHNLLATGSGDMNEVMIAVEKADVSFQLMMQVRNKIVSAYQDIEKMQF